MKKKRSTRWKEEAEKDRGRFLRFRFHILARAKSIKYLLEFELEDKTRKKRSTRRKKRRKKERKKHRRRFSFYHERNIYSIQKMKKKRRSTR